MYTLSDAIIQQDLSSVQQMLRQSSEINELDEYGFTPLIEAAIVENIEISAMLLANGALPNGQDVTGATPLHWAVENNNIELVKLLLRHKADVNAYNFAGQPAIVLPILRQQTPMRQLLLRAGADIIFAQDYINAKLLGHMYELVGPALILDPKNNFVEVDFEGFFLQVTLATISGALAQFQNHFAARKLRRFAGITKLIVEAMQRAEQLIKYQQYRVDLSKVDGHIDELLAHDYVIIPVGYEGHAITFIRSGDIWVKCDRREDSRLYDHVVFYRITRPEHMRNDLIKSLIYVKQSDEAINVELDKVLGLQVITELKVEAQISGNCSWANVEAAIPAIFFLVMAQVGQDDESLVKYKKEALNFFHRFRDWNKDRALHYCMQAFMNGDKVRKATKAEMLAAILFQRADIENQNDNTRMISIIELLIGSPYQYILDNYLRTYHYKQHTEEGKRFAQWLDEHGYRK